MAKKQEDIIELTDIVEEDDTKGSKQEDDLDKELEELLDGTEKDSAQEGQSEEKSLDDELDALLEGNESPLSSDSDAEKSEDEELDIDSIFEKLDEDLSVDGEEDTIKDVSGDTEKEPKKENLDTQKGSETVSQDDIDSLFDEQEDDASSPKTEVQEDQGKQEKTTEIEEKIEEDKNEKHEVEQGQQPEVISEEKERKELDEIVTNLENKLHHIETKFSQLEDTILSRLEEITGAKTSSEQGLNVDSIFKKFDELKEDIKASIETVDKKIQEISARIDTIETSQQKNIKDFFDDLKKELIEEVHRLVPAEAARVVREEIKALEEELEEEV
ncbi:hypothetical protein [Desulfothermus sp.]